MLSLKVARADGAPNTYFWQCLSEIAFKLLDFLHKGKTVVRLRFQPP